MASWSFYFHDVRRYFFYDLVPVHVDFRFLTFLCRGFGFSGSISGAPIARSTMERAIRFKSASSRFLDGFFF